MEVEPKVTALHPKLADAVPQIITEAKARGLVVAMFSGVRKPEEQEKLYALGRTLIPRLNDKRKGKPFRHNYIFLINALEVRGRGDIMIGEYLF